MITLNYDHAAPRRVPRRNSTQVIDSTCTTPTTPPRAYARETQRTPLINAPRARVYYGVVGVVQVESKSYNRFGVVNGVVQTPCGVVKPCLGQKRGY